MIAARQRLKCKSEVGASTTSSSPSSTRKGKVSWKFWRVFTLVLCFVAACGVRFACRIEAGKRPKENAVIVVLTRNEEADALTVTIANFEKVFNSRYSYPYVFLNDQQFTAEFKAAIAEVASGPCTFVKIPNEYWDMPLWINRTRVEAGMKAMEDQGVIYGGSLSYRSMCRFNSGFFFRMPELATYDYYWRLEPGVRFLCNVDFDPFQYVRTKKIKYSFVITLPEIASTVPELFEHTVRYQQSHNIPRAHLDHFRDKRLNWNLCHYWSNFEIADLNFFRSGAMLGTVEGNADPGMSTQTAVHVHHHSFGMFVDQYIDYFNYLDSTGGFFYHRYGDAPVHSLATALFLNPDEVHFFDEIGYEHPPFAHLPVGKSALTGQCLTKEEVERNGEGSVVLDWNSNSCLTRWLWRWRNIRAHHGQLHATHPDQDIHDLADRVRRRAQRLHKQRQARMGKAL